MPRPTFQKFTFRMSLMILCLALSGAVGQLCAQTTVDTQTLKSQISELLGQKKMTEALPLLEQLVRAEPDNPQAHFFLGFALIGQANVTSDTTAANALRVRARNSFIKAKELGSDESILDGLIAGIPADGSVGAKFSQNKEADRLMTEAEALFSQGKLDEAQVNYQKALALDPKLYEAALFAGDAYSQRDNFAQAEVWYQKAIAIDPTRETAYRYSATPLIKQKKMTEARDRLIEAYITEPYTRFPTAALGDWAHATGTQLGHPKIEIPATVNYTGPGNAQIAVGTQSSPESKEDGTFAWMSYGITRVAWHNERFAKAFPKETKYRHSLAEEAAALRAVLSALENNKQVKVLNPALAKLKQLNDEGLLEAYILLATPDEGIAEDHPAYLSTNRDKLRLYMVKYVVTNGGN